MFKIESNIYAGAGIAEAVLLTEVFNHKRRARAAAREKNY